MTTKRTFEEMFEDFSMRGESFGLKGLDLKKYIDDCFDREEAEVDREVERQKAKRQRELEEKKAKAQREFEFEIERENF